MKTNLKKVFALIFAVMFVFCFAACGEKKAPVIGISQYGEHESLDNCREGFLQGLKDDGLVEAPTIPSTTRTPGLMITSPSRSPRALAPTMWP